MSCPDNLLIGARKGALGGEEQARLDAHMAQCSVCRLALQVGSDFDAALHTMPGDDLIAARFARNLGPKYIKERAQPASRKPSALRYAWVAAALLAVLAGGGFAAARLGGLEGFGFEREPRPVAPTKPQPRTKAVERVVSQPAIEAPTPAPQPISQQQDQQAAASERQATPSAAELFARANAQRRDGQAVAARNLYRQLQRAYPNAPEVEVSLTSLGRVYLELGEASDALVQFERYLSKHPRGALAEEALFGKASALSRLGRVDGERQTWSALLKAFPHSLYADRARQRLEHIP